MQYSPLTPSALAYKSLQVESHPNHRIRHFDICSQEVTTFAGSQQGFADGVGTNAEFSYPTKIAMNAAGTFAVVVGIHFALQSPF